jgi:hypothetical protein
MSFALQPPARIADNWMVTRLFGYLSVLAVLAASGYAFLGPERLGGLNPIGKASEAEAGAERASAKYTLAIVAGQLDQVHVVTGTYADTLDFGSSFVRLVRADAYSYCLEYKKTQETYFVAGPGGTVALGTC